jgi:hypothetical protein
MKMRTLVLALALAVTGSFGMAQASTPKTAKAPKFKTAKINTKNQSKFQKSHKIPKRAKLKAPAKHTAQKVAVNKSVKPKKHS